MVATTTFKDYFCFYRKFLVYNLISRNLKLRYRKSLLGLLWTILIPAGTACIYYFVFSFILKVKVPNYLLFILSGLIPWTFFSLSLSTGMESIVANYGLLNKVPLPPHALPYSEVLTHFLNLILSLPVLAASIVLLRQPLTLAALQYPILITALFFIAYSSALILAFMFVFLRDLKHLVGLILQLWFYLTPVMYSGEMIPERFRFVLYLNPVGSIFSGFHSSLVEGTWLSEKHWLCILIWLFVLLFISKFVLSRFKSTVVEAL